jgi:hypothetical protein
MDSRTNFSLSNKTGMLNEDFLQKNLLGFTRNFLLHFRFFVHFNKTEGLQGCGWNMLNVCGDTLANKAGHQKQ